MRAPVPFSVVLTFLTFLILFSTENHSPEPQASLGTWFFEEFQPAIKPGGRANTVAVHPKNDKVVLVTSESGGLFKSTDSGQTWHHVDTLPVFYTNAVTFVPSDSKTVILSASEDFGITGADRGGIWRSEDEGDTWTQVAKTSFAVATGAERLSAYEISIAPDTGKIYVGSNRGLLISNDTKGMSWGTPIDPFVDIAGVYNPAVLSVLALPVTNQGCGSNPSGGNLVLVGGPSGIRRSTDGGQHWCQPKKDPGCQPLPMGADTTGCVMDVHAFGRSPDSTNGAYVAVPKLDGDEVFIHLYETSDAGDTWKDIHTAAENCCRPNGGCCGGIAAVKAVRNGGSTDLYLSNRCSIEKRSGMDWKLYIHWSDTSDAGDTRDLAFNGQNEPYLSATDGGVIKAPAPTDINPRWRFAGANGKGNVVNGYSALQIYEVKGQWIANSRHDLYFGTQDNQLWTSNDTGKTWAEWGNEGFFIEGQYHVANESDSQITFKVWDNRLSGPLFKNPAPKPWFNPPFHVPNTVSTPKIVRKNFHIQGVEPLKSLNPQQLKFAMKKGLAVTSDLGSLWQQYAMIDEDRRDLPRLCCTAPHRGSSVFYQAIRYGWDASLSVDIDHLVRITKGINESIASVDHVDMNGFKGLGITPTMGVPFRVFAVDPHDPNHLIAADLIGGAMKETSDGGDNWTTMTELTSLVTNNSQLNFSGLYFLNGLRAGVASEATAVSFCPDDPRMVAVGTVQSGVLVSGDRGKTWTKVPGSNRATLISSLHWRKCDDLIVSTYGRGLWRARINKPIVVIPCKSPDCLHVYVKPPPPEQPSPFELSVRVFNGRIEGARVINGMLEELFVEPSASVAFAGRFQDAPQIKVTETTNPVGFQGISNVPAAPREAPMVTGITLRKSGTGYELLGLMFSPNRLPLFVSEGGEPSEQEPTRRARPSRRAGQPYLEVVTGPGTVPGRVIQLAGRGFKPGSVVEIAIDGHSKRKVRVERRGTFLATVRTPMQFGTHAITVKDGNGKIIDGTTISVTPEDPPTPRERGRPNR